MHLNCDFPLLICFRNITAEFILGFGRTIDPILAVGKSIVRVDPSNARLEQALLEGKTIKTNCPVWFGEDSSEVEEDSPQCSHKIVAGDKFDFVVSACIYSLFKYTYTHVHTNI